MRRRAPRHPRPPQLQRGRPRPSPRREAQVNDGLGRPTHLVSAGHSPQQQGPIERTGHVLYVDAAGDAWCEPWSDWGTVSSAAGDDGEETAGRETRRRR